MAPQVTDLAVANALLKDDYKGPIRSAVNTATPLWDRLVKNTEDIAGRAAVIPIEMALDQGAGARKERAVLPEARDGEYEEARSQLRSYYGNMGVTGQVIRQTSKGEKGSFGRIIDVKAKSMTRLLKTVLAHDSYLGDSLAVTKAGDANNVVELDDAAAANTNMEYFKKNMLVDVVGSDGSTILLAAAKIDSVDKPNKTITLVDKDTGAAANVTEQALGKVVRAGTLGAAMTSLDEIVSTTADIYGITTASFEEWRATVNSTFGSFTIDKFEEHLNDIAVFSGKTPTIIVGDYKVQRLYLAKLTANTRYMVAGDAMKTLNGGFRALEYSSGSSPIPWVADRLAPFGTIYSVHEPDIQVFSPEDFDFLEIGGDVWLPNILGSTPKDEYTAILFRDVELGATNRNSHGKLEGVTA